MARQPSAELAELEGVLECIAEGKGGRADCIRRFAGAALERLRAQRNESISPGVGVP